MRQSLSEIVRRGLPLGVLNVYRLLRRPRLGASIRFVREGRFGGTTATWRLQYVLQLYRTSLAVDAPHSQDEMLRVADAILGVPAGTPGCIVEAGAYKGASTAKLSLVAARTGRKLFVFDSFRGMPPNDEGPTETLYGTVKSFPEGSYAGSLKEVRTTVARFGSSEHCEFVPGWLEDTTPQFREPIVTAYIDVDLASSTRTCLKYLWPLVVPGGIVFSQDGHLAAVRAVLADESFWRDQVGCARPPMRGLGKMRMVQLLKQPQSGFPTPQQAAGEHRGRIVGRH